jgi:hypothetical protein
MCHGVRTADAAFASGARAARLLARIDLSPNDIVVSPIEHERERQDGVKKSSRTAHAHTPRHRVTRVSLSGRNSFNFPPSNLNESQREGE